MKLTVKRSKRTQQEETILTGFAANLKKARNTRSLSQEELAHLAGFSRSYYTEVETGQRNISLLNLCKILMALKVEASDLIKFQERE